MNLSEHEVLPTIQDRNNILKHQNSHTGSQNNPFPSLDTERVTSDLYDYRLASPKNPEDSRPRNSAPKPIPHAPAEYRVCGVRDR